MRDRVEQALENLKSEWGPLLVRRLPDVVEMMKKSISDSTADQNIRRAIFMCFLAGIEERSIDDDAWIEQAVIEAILVEIGESEKVLYHLYGSAAEPNTNPLRGGDDDDYYSEIEVLEERILHNDFGEVVLEAHERMTRIIDCAPSSMTNCKVEVYMVDNGSLISLGMWVWDRKESRTHWIEPERQ